MDKTAINKRRFERLDAYHLVKYKLLSTPKSSPVLASLKNISAGGICLNAKEKLPLGELIELTVNFLWAPKPVSIIAKIVWVKKPGKKNNYYYGLEFSEIEELIRKDIYERVKNAR